MMSMAAGNSTPRLTLAMDLDRVEELSADLERIAEAHPLAMPLLRGLVGHFKSRVPHYHWVGIYLLEHSNGRAQTLVLGPFAGNPVSQPRVGLDEGAVGAAAGSAAVVVTAEPVSELAVPIADAEGVLGVIDIATAQPNAFNEHDQALLERAASLLAGALRRAPEPPRWSSPEAIAV